MQKKLCLFQHALQVFCRSTDERQQKKKKSLHGPLCVMPEAQSDVLQVASRRDTSAIGCPGAEPTHRTGPVWGGSPLGRPWFNRVPEAEWML